MNSLHRFILRQAQRIHDNLRRPPDYVIPREDGGPYLFRWYVIPRNKFFNIYAHEFKGSDDPRALHDHPYLFNLSIICEGYYKEIFEQGQRYRPVGTILFRWGKSPHRIMLFRRYATSEYIPAKTIFITGPVVREWGFYCPKGWVHWKIFTSKRDNAASTSRGCE